MDSSEYLVNQGLGFLLELGDRTDYKPDVFDSVSGSLTVPFKIQPDDLARLHQLVRRRKSFTVLEFGLGYSSIVMAHALHLNKKEWDALEPKVTVRNRFMFKLFSVDTSAHWIAQTEKRFPEHLRPYVDLHHSGVSIGTFNGQLCHYYDRLPDVVPDFIYLDGPHPKDIKGDIRGLSFTCDERTVIGGDLLLMEPTFLPGTFILVDGRTNNARFLQRNFQRSYKIDWDRKADVTTFELDEERLGRYNVLGSDYLK